MTGDPGAHATFLERIAETLRAAPEAESEDRSAGFTLEAWGDGDVVVSWRAPAGSVGSVQRTTRLATLVRYQCILLRAGIPARVLLSTAAPRLVCMRRWSR